MFPCFKMSESQGYLLDGPDRLDSQTERQKDQTDQTHKQRGK